MFTYFNNKSIRNLVVAFGSLFNNIHVRRFNSNGTTKENLRVPLAYGSREKFLARIEQGGSITNEDGEIVQMTLPRMSFEISSINYDETRKRQTVLKSPTRATGSTRQYSFSEVPYDISFDLHVMVKHMDDGLQIVEQILPYFTPEFTVTINATDVHKKVDIPIQLTDVSQDAEYEGDFEARRSITFTLSFTAKSYVYGRLYDTGIIRRVFAELFIQNDSVTGPFLTGLTGGVNTVASGVCGSTGGVAGMCGGVAASLIDISITGPSGASSDITDYTPVITIRPFGGTSGNINMFGDILE
tara:strand:+ start:175 stop:1074 length:900 start_codon:yes stop_codon:yes gene_type:complete